MASFKYLKTRQVVEMVGLSRSAIYVMMGRGEFPKPRNLAGKINRWRDDELLEWMESRPQATTIKTTVNGQEEAS